MKYKVGDRVKVREDLQPNQKYGCTLLNSMYETLLANPVVTIKKCRTIDGMKVYNINECDRNCLYAEEMFEGLADEQPSNVKHHKLDYQPSRLEVAARVMQGLLSSGFALKQQNSYIADYALQLADELIKQEQETRK